MIRTTSSPASSPASRVACRWPSLKKAGTVITAFETGWPSDLLGPALERPQDDRRDLLRRVLLVAQRDGHLLAHLPLDRPDGPLRGQDVLVARGLADQQVALRVQADDRRQDRVAVLVGQDDRAAVADDGHLAVGRPQVDADDRLLVHVCDSFDRSDPSEARPAGLAADRCRCPGRCRCRRPSSSWSGSISPSSLAVAGRRRRCRRRSPSSAGSRRGAAAGVAGRLDLGVAEQPALPGVAAPQLLDHGPGRPVRVVDDLDDDHPLGIDRAGPRRGCARSARPPSPGASRFWIRPYPSRSESKQVAAQPAGVRGRRSRTWR